MRHNDITSVASNLLKALRKSSSSLYWKGEWEIRLQVDDDLPGEEWRVAVDKDGVTPISSLHAVSNLGRVHFKIGNRKTYGTLKNEYYTVMALGRNYRVHNLVAAAWLGAIPVGHTVNHMDGNSKNNAASNFDFQTPKGQMVHAVGKPVLVTFPDGRAAQTFVTGATAAAALGVSNACVCGLLNGQHKQSRGGWQVSFIE